MVARIKNALTRVLYMLLIGIIRLYQYGVSPLLGPRCRFWPTCSNYAVEALQLHGPFKGGWLALKRILKCHPWHAGGVDPVPPLEGCPCCSIEDRQSTANGHQHR